MKALIFDLDGVIVSTDKYHYAAWKKLADSEGIYFDENINNRLRGVSRMESLEIILERSQKNYSKQQKFEMAEKKNDIYKQMLTNLSVSDRLQGVTETLEYLRARGFKIAVGSSSKNAGFILNKIGYQNYFDAVVDGNDISSSKPNPEVFLKAAAALLLLPEQCLVVEDAIAGVDAAVNGGFKCAGLKEAANYPKASYRLKDISDILKII